MFHTILVLSLIIAISLACLCIRYLCGRRTFVHTHVSGSPALTQRGISCAQSQDRMAQRHPSFIIQEHQHR